MNAKRIATAVMALACAAATAPAFAGAHTHASIGPISYTLTDLDLNDGIAPSLTFLDSMQTSAGYLIGGGRTEGIQIPSPWAPVQVQSVSGASAASFQISNPSGWGLEGMSLSASGSAWGGAQRTSYQVMAYGLYPEDDYVPQFLLTPNSAVTFEAVASLSTSVDRDGPLGMARGELVFGVVQGAADQWEYMKLSASNRPDFNMPLSQSITQLLSLQIENTTDNAARGALRASFDIWGNVDGSLPGVASAVPEPGTWALMVSGLALVGAAARRRRQQDASN